MTGRERIERVVMRDEGSCDEPDKFPRQLATLASAIEAEPVEDGISHAGEILIADVLSVHGADELATAILQAASSSLQASMVRLIGRVSVEDALVRRRIVDACLRSSDLQMRDAAVQAVESWEDTACVDLLRRHEEPVDWLADYIRDVIADVAGWPNVSAGTEDQPREVGGDQGPR